MLVPWALITSFSVICSVLLGLLTNSHPKPLSDIITSSTFNISYNNSLEDNEFALIDLDIGKGTVTWEKKIGPVQNWKIIITLHSFDNKNSLHYLAKLLFMQKDLYENDRYFKVIFIKDWPKQEYLINYWLKSLY